MEKNRFPVCPQIQYLTVQLCDSAGFSSHNTCRRYAEGYSTKAGWQSELHVLKANVLNGLACAYIMSYKYIVFTIGSDRHTDKKKILQYNFFHFRFSHSEREIIPSSNSELGGHVSNGERSDGAWITSRTA